MSGKKKKKGQKLAASILESNAGENESSNFVTKGVEYEDIRKLLQSFYHYRQESIKLMENLINLLNKRTYYERDKIQSITSALAKSSLFSGSIEEELIEIVSSLQTERFRTLECLKQLQSCWYEFKLKVLEGNEKLMPISVETMEDVLSQLNQQSVLDELIADQLLLNPHKQRNQDELVTMASCIKQAPYLKEVELKAIFEMR